jgi:hypothetical protein
MTGIELAERIRALRPGLPVIIASGYSGLPAGEGTRLPRLDKPYRLDTLSALFSRLSNEGLLPRKPTRGRAAFVR